jgi:hypothetical protein
MEQLFQVVPPVFAHAPGSTAHVLHRDYETRSQAILKLVGPTDMLPIRAVRCFAVHMPLMTIQCSCGVQAAQYLRNFSKLRATPIG